MRNLLIAAAITMVSASAMASKARLTALGNAAHLSDTQTIFSQPAYLHELGDWATLEFGETAAESADADATPNAEGGFVKSMGDAKYGFFLGHQSESTDNMRALASALVGSTFLGMENPVDLFYGAKAGDMKWGASFTYSNSDNKDDNTKQSAMGVRFGARAGLWDAYARLGLGSTADHKANDDKYKGTTGIAVGGGYNVNENMYAFISYGMDGFKAEDNGTDALNYEATVLEVGMTNNWKVDGGNFFYGVSLTQTNQKDKETDLKYEEMALPFLIGVEADATSWMVLRGSVKQNVILGSVKGDKLVAGNNDVDHGTVDHNTTVAAGAGFKFNKLMFDVTLTSATTANLGSDDLGGNAALTYTF